jgi:hypothetical protein
MQIPETPKTVTDLDLMRRLDSYAEGSASWEPQTNLGPRAQSACRVLHTNIVQFVEKALAPLLGRIGAREMDTFTMHDHMHGLKVAHLMWHILASARRERLTPPEIGILVLAAHFHDVGMALNKEERLARLGPGSDLWDKLEVQELTRARLDQLRKDVANTNETISRRAKLELDQAEEALLCQDTRERHATRGRYEEVLGKLRNFHDLDPENIPSVDSCLSFDGDSFAKKLIDVCVSHNQDEDALVQRDPENPERPRFPNEFPVGSSSADLHLTAAALRVADILDFDRERTPRVLFYYLVPGTLSPMDNRAALEWRKHMAISNWHIDRDAIVFRGRCNDHIIHHAIVQFCASIQKEIAGTRATFGAMQEGTAWPLDIPGAVKAEIYEEGYHYVPYRFELDDERIYGLLMGGAIYDNPLVAVRELVQNAVDACKLRDALTQLHEPFVPMKSKRIFVRYEEPNNRQTQPVVSVSDTGTGMDAFILERYFLRVGQSYYSSGEFNQERVSLRKNGLDFAPVSEFGIGFLSCFLLADRVEVETAMWESLRGDTRRRTLIIDGPTRLIRLDEDPNEGPRRFKGTRVKLHLCRGSGSRESGPPGWEDIRKYLEDVCQDLPYRIELEHVHAKGVVESCIDSKPLTVQIPPYLEPASLRVPVQDSEFGLEGEIALTNLTRKRALEHELVQRTPLVLAEQASGLELMRRGFYALDNPFSELLRGGFKIGEVPGIPRNYIDHTMARARVRLTWDSRKTHRYLAPNLARNGSADDRTLAYNVVRVWMTYLLEHRDELSEGQLDQLSVFVRLRDCNWLEKFDAYAVYCLAAQGLRFELKHHRMEARLATWEEGKEDRLWLGEGHSFCEELLEIVLPKIASLLLGPDGKRYVSRPHPDWKAILRECRDYVTHPTGWGLFVKYVDGIQKLLWYDWGGGYDHFNSRFQQRLESFTEEDLTSLMKILKEVSESRENHRPANLNRADAQLLARSTQELGDLSFGSMYGTWRIGSLKPPTGTAGT